VAYSRGNGGWSISRFQRSSSPAYLPREIIRSPALHPMIQMIINIPAYSVPVSKRKQPGALLIRTTLDDLIAAI